ncbi:PP2C family protein-serine/threonine phosphatase [Brevibacillus agri]|uniref:PP2C family protein-serine/threonine phosphatase n=1 Tax=Brevibacillus agri TaxID=51101 RepID=UPI001EE53B53|nr:PP2C family protein-serine/threonine phosphatase [Brevibacillus agri]MCG5250583.1 serine/threonine-protein phosphatase [Brevibacillus agri]
MIWKIALYLSGIGAGVYLIRLSYGLQRQVQRGFDLSLLHGIGLVAWGIGSLLVLSFAWWGHGLGLPVCTGTYLAGIISLVFLLQTHRRLRQKTESEGAHVESQLLLDWQRITRQHTGMVQVILLVIAASLLALPEMPLYVKGGLAVAIAYMSVRAYLNNRDHHYLLTETLSSVSTLESRLTQQLAHSEWMNQQLSLVGKLKQSYEGLLIASNKISVSDVHYDSIHQLTSELVDAWFGQIHTLVYLGISWESEQGDVYFHTERGKRADRGAVQFIEERIVVSEQWDTAKTPRYVRLVAQTAIGEHDMETKELEQSFFQLLLVNVRGLILRCLHEHQSTELKELELGMGLARRIQSMLIPKEEWQVNGLRARTVYVPVTYVGGDYIDFVRINERYTCFIVADVSGHGLPASIWATGIRIAVRAVLQTSWSPDEILQRLNQLLYADLAKTRSYITMLVAVYDATRHELLLARAGHPQPIYLSSTQKNVLRCRGGVGLGLLSDSTYQLEEVPLLEEGILLLYTDGLLDTGRKDVLRSSHGLLEDLAALLDEPGKEETMERVESYLWAMTGQGQQTDDISVLILQFQSGSHAGQRRSETPALMEYPS